MNRQNEARPCQGFKKKSKTRSLLARRLRGSSANVTFQVQARRLPAPPPLGGAAHRSQPAMPRTSGSAPFRGRGASPLGRHAW